MSAFSIVVGLPKIHTAKRILWAFALLVILQLPVFAMATTIASAKPCSVTAQDFDTRADIHALDSYKRTIEQLLDEGNFDQLDCIANAARSGQTKFSGGFWELHIFYQGIDQIKGEASDDIWQARIAKIQKWVAVKPESITARVALADAYTSYGWYARGNGTADTVTENGWRLLRERRQKAYAILLDAGKLPVKCPEWFIAMLTFTYDGDSGIHVNRDILQDAIAFEPGYYYFYRVRATNLLPQWYGEDGDVAKFAAQSADHVGGNDGNILYFQIAEQVVCCDKDQFMHMSWPRLQAGYFQLQAKYGKSLLHTNLFARMAVRENDELAADEAFKQIGENWDEETWETKSNFTGARRWAAAVVEDMRNNAAAKREAENNMRMPGGLQYKQKFDQNLVGFLQRCVQKESADTRRSELYVQVGKNGNIENFLTLDATPVAECLLGEFTRSTDTRGTPFPAPPMPSYWVELELDPAAARVARK